VHHLWPADAAALVRLGGLLRVRRGPCARSVYDERVGENRGVNFAGWMIGLAVAAALALPFVITLLCCGGGALIGVVGSDPSATP